GPKVGRPIVNVARRICPGRIGKWVGHLRSPTFVERGSNARADRWFVPDSPPPDRPVPRGRLKGPVDRLSRHIYDLDIYILSHYYFTLRCISGQPKTLNTSRISVYRASWACDKKVTFV